MLGLLVLGLVWGVWRGCWRLLVPLGFLLTPDSLPRLAELDAMQIAIVIAASARALAALFAWREYALSPVCSVGLWFVCWLLVWLVGRVLWDDNGILLTHARGRHFFFSLIETVRT